ncbi:MAG TPA: hypothetical protein VGI20_03200 [Rhizomicrobium sp.]|jgi:hypothetical protein
MRTRTKRRNPRYTVDVALKAQDIARLGAALTFQVRSGDAMLGTIEIGQGGFRWKARSGKFFRRIGWSRFFERLQRA